MNNHKTEILIIGGGIAGCIAAISLADTYNVSIVDKLETPPEKVGESLAPAAQRILNKLQLFTNTTEQEKLFINNLGMQSYWGSDQVRIVDHLRNPDGCSKSLDRQQFEIFLRKKVEEKGVHCFWGTRLFNSFYENKAWKITCKTDLLKNRTTDIFNTNFVIDATGRNSHFARSLQINRTSFDSLISCWLTLPNKEKNTMSTITTDSDGWWYSAVTPKHKRVICFQTDADLIDKSYFKNYDSFFKIIKTNQIINNYIKKEDINKIQFHGVVSANSTKLNQVCGTQWLALGDAAISFDPLSSQGMFNAIASAMQVTELLQDYKFIRKYDHHKITDFSKAYTSQITSIWNSYLNHKNIFYGTEKRWKEHPFWKRRHQHSLKDSLI